MSGTVLIIEQAARELRERHGPEVIPIIRELAKNAAELVDEIAAKEWRDIGVRRAMGCNACAQYLA